MADPSTLPLAVPLWLASSLILGLGLHVTCLFFGDFTTPLFKMAPRLNLWNSLSFFLAYLCMFHLKTVYFMYLSWLLFVSSFQNVSSRRAGVFPAVCSYSPVLRAVFGTRKVLDWMSYERLLSVYLRPVMWIIICDCLWCCLPPQKALKQTRT